MGKLISVYMDLNASNVQKILATTALVPVALVKLVATTVKSLFDPTETMRNIISAVATIGKHANSVILKGLIVSASIIPLAVLAPFVLVEQGLKQTEKLFQALGNWMTKKSPGPENADIASVENDGLYKESHHSMIAGLVARQVKENLKELGSQETPLDILAHFEINLENNPGKLITLSEKDFDTLNKYVREKNIPDLTRRFQACCDETLYRANKLWANTPEKEDKVIEEDSPFHETKVIP